MNFILLTDYYYPIVKSGSVIVGDLVNEISQQGNQTKYRNVRSKQKIPTKGPNKTSQQINQAKDPNARSKRKVATKYPDKRSQQFLMKHTSCES